MDGSRYQDLLSFLTGSSAKRKWPDWIKNEQDSEKRRRMKTTFRATACGGAQKAGFRVDNGLLYKRVFKDKKKKTFALPRMVVKAQDVKEMLKKVHDEAGHAGISNTQRNTRKPDSYQIWWKGINADIKDYTSKCPKCIQSGPPPEKSGELKSIKPPKKPFSF